MRVPAVGLLRIAPTLDSTVANVVLCADTELGHLASSGAFLGDGPKRISADGATPRLSTVAPTTDRNTATHDFGFQVNRRGDGRRLNQTLNASNRKEK